MKYLSLLLLISMSALAAGNPVAQIRSDHSLHNVTTSAWYQLLPSLPSTATYCSSFDSGGKTAKIGYIPGGSSLTTPIVSFILFPGGNGPEFCDFPAGSAIYIEAISGNITSGELDLNFYN